MNCAVCDNDTTPNGGYYLTTSEVVTSEECWIRFIEAMRQEASSTTSAKELEGRLRGLIRFATAQTTAWLICEECSELFMFHRTESRPNPSSGTSANLDRIDVDRCLIAAARAWQRVFGQWPATIERPDWAVSRGSCDLCGNDIYVAESAAFLPKEKMEDFLRRGFFDNGPVRPARSHGGDTGWVACKGCSARMMARWSKSKGDKGSTE
jgi:hypothetical protein